MNQLFTIEYTCDKAVHWATESLENAGLQVANSFNLQSARATLVHYTGPHMARSITIARWWFCWHTALAASSHAGRARA